MPLGDALPSDLELSLGVLRAGFPTQCHAKALNWSPNALCEYSLQHWILAVDHQQAPAGHDTHEMVELALDSRKIVEDVGMIELEIVQYCGARPVMHEFGALVEE